MSLPAAIPLPAVVAIEVVNVRGDVIGMDAVMAIGEVTCRGEVVDIGVVQASGIVKAVGADVISAFCMAFCATGNASLLARLVVSFPKKSY